MRIQIPSHVEYIIGKLNQNGYEAFAVGGCVRDTLLGRTPGDWDITTSARPEQVKALFRRTIDTGIQHGTVTVMLEKTGYEVTTYRIDGEYEDGRHPRQVEFTSDLLEDLKRRDFTINAMAYSHETGIVDAFGGVEDLEKRVIRCVGEPMERFEEDALRILRAIRFSAQLDFSIEEKTREAITRIAPNLAKVSRERVQMELTKLLCSDHPEQIRQVYETGISRYVSEEFSRLPWEKAEISPGLPGEKYVRWAAFLRCACPGEEGFRQSGFSCEKEETGKSFFEEREKAVKTGGKILRDLKLDNETIGRVKTLTSWCGEKLLPEAPSVRRAMSKMEPEVWDALMELNQYGEESSRLTKEIRLAGDCLDLKHLAVNGRDLMSAGVRPGKDMGEILNRMLQEVLEHPENNQKEILMSMFVK